MRREERNQRLLRPEKIVYFLFVKAEDVTYSGTLPAQFVEGGRQFYNQVNLRPVEMLSAGQDECQGQVLCKVFPLLLRVFTRLPWCVACAQQDAVAQCFLTVGIICRRRIHARHVR